MIRPTRLPSNRLRLRLLPLYPHAPCFQRCSSTATTTPPTIAALLSPQSAHSSSPTTPPAEVSVPDVTVKGFVRTLRKQKRVAFAAIGDGSSLQTVQAVLSPAQAEGLSTGIAVAITGQWRPSPGQKQSHELQAENVRVLGQNDAAANPLQKKYQTAEFLRTLPHLRCRLPFNALLLRLRSQITAQLTDHFSSLGFVQVHPPLITSSDCEGAGEVFTVAPRADPSSKCHVDEESQTSEDHFFQSPKYLTVSSQLHLEALAQSLSRVWTLSPTFRAEKSDTPRHLSEFYMLEAEVAFAEDLSEIMDLVEGMLRAVTSGLQSSSVGKELLEARKREEDAGGNSITSTALAQRWQCLADGPWPRMTYREALEYLEAAVAEGQVQFDFAPSGSAGLQTEHERFLAENIGRGGPVFVTNYPAKIKPFYMAPTAAKDASGQVATVACFDLLVPEICELVGGSMREHRLSELADSMDEHGLRRGEPTESLDQASSGPLEWYLDLRRFGSVPHGGFGLGFDRLLCYLSGVSNIRDVVTFPRWHKRCDC